MFYLNLFIIIFVGIIINLSFKKIKIPPLIGYLILGIVINYCGLLDENIAIISPYLRKIALIIILVKAGLSLNLSDLKKVGKNAILMSFLPATVEMIVVGLVAPLIFDITFIESFLLGSVLGAVSPAVVVPMMTKLIDEKRGVKKGVPQLILASSSIDDIIMLVFFQAFLALESGNALSFMSFANIFIAIFSGIIVGLLIGYLLNILFKYIDINDNLKLALLLSIGIGLTLLEDYLSKYILFSSLLAVITYSILVKRQKEEVSQKLTTKCSSVWTVAEMFLFFLVGASIKVEYASKYLLTALLILVISLFFRAIAVFISLIKSGFNKKERIFTVISYMPKATVQASIGGILLDLGNKMLENNQINAEFVINAGIIVLSVSVLAILITAPISALIMNLSYKKLLTEDA